MSMAMRSGLRSCLQRALQIVGHKSDVPLFSRPFGAAAALAEDDEYSEDEEWQENVYPVDLSASQCGGGVPSRGVQWVFFGNPILDRGSYASKLASILDVPHISMGSLVRQHLTSKTQLSAAMTEGKLLPDDVIFNLLFRRLDAGAARGETGFVLDGFPRTMMQAEILDHFAEIDLAINLKCNEDAFNKWCPGRRICDEEIFREKLRIYLEQNNALEDYYCKQKKLINFEVPVDQKEAWTGLLAALDLKDTDPATQQLAA